MVDEMNRLQAVVTAMEGTPPQPGGLRFPPNARHVTARTAAIDDLRRDWRRWTPTERALASLIMAGLLICTAAPILMTASGFLSQVLK
jgi:hypothetical protein